MMQLKDMCDTMLVGKMLQVDTTDCTRIASRVAL